MQPTSRGRIRSVVCSAFMLTVGTAVQVNADTNSGCNIGFIASYTDDEETFDGLNGASSVAVYDNSVYVTGKDEDELVVAARNTSNGTLSFLDIERDLFPNDGLGGAAAVAVSPGGEQVYVAAGGDQAVTAFTRASNGQLSPLQMLVDTASMSGASAITVSSDGKNVYATGSTDDALLVLTRNTSTGGITFLQRRLNGPGEGLDGASAVAVSPDLKNVYVTGKLTNSVVTYSRNLTSGAVTYVEQQVQGANMADGLSGAVSVAVSPDGAHVYTAATTDGKIGIYTRNATTGEIDFASVVTSLSAIASVAVSADGSTVYAAGGTTSYGYVRAYSRNSSTGALTLDTNRQDSLTSDAQFYRQATQVAVAVPDGAHVYLSADRDDSVSAFVALEANGTTCDDTNVCTGPDTCNGSGTCLSGTCNVGQQCIAPGCKAGLCDTASGCSCVAIP